jgi:hypothetical protein
MGALYPYALVYNEKMIIIVQMGAPINSINMPSCKNV